MLIDSHCHINALSSVRQAEVISGGRDKFLFIDSSIDRNTSDVSLRLSSSHDCVYSALGFHPISLRTFDSGTLEFYEKSLDQSGKIAAIGEIGLDYKAEATMDQQEKVLDIFLNLAMRRGLAVMLHNRMRGVERERILKNIDRVFSDYQDVIFHCFSYDAGFMEKIAGRGGYVSFSLNILRKNKDIIEALRRCPVDNLLLESDSPYMKIGDRPSTPLDVGLVYEFAAQVRGTTPQELENKVEANARRAFKIIGRNRA